MRSDRFLFHGKDTGPLEFFNMRMNLGLLTLGLTLMHFIGPSSFAQNSNSSIPMSTKPPPPPLLRMNGMTSTESPSTFWYTLQTRLRLLSEDYDSAYQNGLKALESDPLRPELHINLGNALEGLGSFKKARESYEVVEKLSPNPLFQFQSYFNRAQNLAKEKRVEEALAFYQKALEINPDSKEVKTNIELLMSSKGGKGKGDSEDKNKDDESGDGEGENKEGSENQDKQKDGKEPKKFAENPKESGEKKQPQNLAPSDVKKILEEIKQQEQRIRGDFNKQQPQNGKDEKGGEAQREKDW